MCGCQNMSSFNGSIYSPTSNANGDDELSWWDKLWGKEAKTGNQLEAEELKKEAEEKGLTPEEYAKQLEEEGDLEKSSKLKQWIDDGTINKAVDILDNVWDKWKGGNSNATSVSNNTLSSDDDENVGLYVGIGVTVLLVILGVIYFVKNNK